MVNQRLDRFINPDRVSSRRMATLLPDEATTSRAEARIKAWLLICFGLGLLLTNYPFLQIFNQPLSLGGIPLIIVYLLGLWLLGVVVLFILTRALAKLSAKD
jgi:hypothetical protein